ncbi:MULTISPECIES: hypothetical protein [Streptomyces]|uniref:Uncharacterized protein n=1 Tax=Streptomyces alboflavus TaxID=67267 RepID=A0A1Z1WFH3_9ACTN|nr:hypothetical protein [Streptomyces alboflavus]ARX85194.1 hypothetical protein SMD44_04653 [Streptomyces alboflavus]
MDTNDLTEFPHLTEFPDLDRAYRDHLDNCPGIHLGILADCPEGARLRDAWEGRSLGSGASAHA